MDVGRLALSTALACSLLGTGCGMVTGTIKARSHQSSGFDFSLSWVQPSLTNSATVTATWSISGSSATNQQIQFYSDSSCTTAYNAPIDLGSGASTQNLTAIDGAYSYTITATDSQSQSATSDCSPLITIDLTPPTAPTSLSFAQGSLTNQTSLTAQWVKSVSSDLADQKIKFFSDGSCTTALGSWVDLNSNALQSQTLVGSNGNTYTFQIQSTDYAGNTSTSSCSSSVTVNTTPPNLATSLSWVQSSPYDNTSVTAQWTKSTSTITDQKIQFYSDGTCTTTSGSLIDLSSSTLQTENFTGSNGSTYTFEVVSVDGAGNTSTSACSTSMTIDTTAPNAATSLGWTTSSPSGVANVTASWIKSSSGDLSDEKIQFYADGSCTTTTGSLIDLSSSTAQTDAFTGSNGTTYTYKIVSVDTAGNTSTSGCSSSMQINTAGPLGATSLSWAESSPYNNTAVQATWTKSTSGTLTDQEIQFYSDSTCTTTSGSLIDLSSTTQQSYNFTGTNGTTYTYIISSLDGLGHSTPSSCSTSMSIDTTAPNNATSLSWTQTSPYNNTSVQASWTKSTSGDLSDQKIQFYSDGTCTTPTGSLIDLSSATAQTENFTGTDGSTYTYKITSLDQAGNTNTSACSSAMAIDTTAPNNATSLSWTQTSPYNNTSVQASWTKSSSGDLSDEKIQFYSDGTCTTTTGSLIDLSSSTLQTENFTGTDGTTYTYKLTSLDQAGNSNTSGCSSTMVIDTTAPTVSITSNPSNPSSSSSATFSFSGSDSGSGVASYKCQIDSGGYSACSTGQTYNSLTLGSHTFNVESIDNAGNISTAASYTWTIQGTFSRVDLQSNSGSLSSTTYGDFTGNPTKFNVPGNVLIYGNYMYVVSETSNVINRIDMTTGQSIIWAGSTAGFSDGLGTAAQFQLPGGMVTDGTYIYLADSSNAAIRKIQISNANVTTMASGLPYQPNQLAFDSAGTHLYTTGLTDDTVDIVTISDGSSSLFAGQHGVAGQNDGAGASATFYGPAGLIRIGSTLYVGDTFNCAIRAIDIPSDTVSSVVPGASCGNVDGNGLTTAKIERPFSFATDNTYLYFGDYDNHSIRTMNLTSPYTVTTIAGSTAGNTGKVDGSGTSARFDYPDGITLSSGLLYITEDTNNDVRKMDLSTSEVTNYAGVMGSSGEVAGFRLTERSPYHLTSDGTNIYWADTANNRIQEMGITSGTVSTLAGSGVAGLTNATGTSAKFKAPHGVTTDGTNLYVSDTENQVIRMIVISTGAVTTIAGKVGAPGSTNNATGTSASFNYPSDLVYYSGNLYVTDTGNHTIRKVSTTSPYAVTLFAGTSGTSGATNNATGTSATFKYPTGITTDGTNLYVTDENQLIRQITIGGTQTVTTLAGSSGTTGSANGTGTAATFNYPRGVTTDNTNLYVADYGNDLIRQIVISTGVVTTLTGTAGSGTDADGVLASATFASPLGIIYTSSGLFVSNSYNIRLIH